MWLAFVPTESAREDVTAITRRRFGSEPLIGTGPELVDHHTNLVQRGAERIGFAGFSMGGTITSLVSIDRRLKAVSPFVGGSGFRHVDFPGGLQGSSARAHFQNVELYESTIDASAYWPLVACRRTPSRSRTRSRQQAT